MRFRKRLYISEELQYIIVSNLGLGFISFVMDVYGVFNLALEPAYWSLIVGFIDVLTNLFLIRRYIKKKKKQNDL